MKSSPLTDLTYDVITVLHNKAKALEAYDKYIQDAEDDEELLGLFRAIRRHEEEHVRILTEALARRLDEDLGFEDDDAEDEDEDVWDAEDDDEDDRISASAGDDDGADESDVTRAESSDVEESEVVSTGHVPRRGESTHRR